MVNPRTLWQRMWSDDGDLSNIQQKRALYDGLSPPASDTEQQVEGRPRWMLR